MLKRNGSRDVSARLAGRWLGGKIKERKSILYEYISVKYYVYNMSCVKSWVVFSIQLDLEYSEAFEILHV